MPGSLLEFQHTPHSSTDLLADPKRESSMTVTYDTPIRGSHGSMATLEDRFEVIKEVGDGSFGSVAVARVRTAGAHIARRGTMVRISNIVGECGLPLTPIGCD